MAFGQSVFLLLRWLIVASVVMSVSSLELICGGTQCPECKPPGQRSAPSVGIDLTMAYATAAMQFKNGTVRDLAKIDGSPEYRAAMRAITADATNIRNGLHSSLERVYFQDPTWRNPYPLSKYWKMPWAWWYNFPIWRRQLVNHFYPQSAPEYFSDEWIRAVTAILSEVKSTTMDTLDPPLEFNDVYLSWPDPLYYMRETYKERFQLACHLAGLKTLGNAGTIVSIATLQNEGIDFYPDKLMEDDPRAMLLISYNLASLGITLKIRDEWHFPEPVQVIESPAHGAEHVQHDDPKSYWGQVQELLETTIGDTPVDYVVLIGSHAREPNFLHALEEVFDRHDNIQPSVLERYKGTDFGLGEDKDDLLFLGARAAAATARFGMEEVMDYYCYMPAWCVPDEEEPVRYVRSEL
ncbi:hypothetical protein BJX65DRAFT_281493 [Aspergillus insuetus]